MIQVSRVKGQTRSTLREPGKSRQEQYRTLPNMLVLTKTDVYRSKPFRSFGWCSLPWLPVGISVHDETVDRMSEAVDPSEHGAHPATTPGQSVRTTVLLASNAFQSEVAVCLATPPIYCNIPLMIYVTPANKHRPACGWRQSQLIKPSPTEPEPLS